MIKGNNREVEQVLKNYPYIPAIAEDLRKKKLQVIGDLPKYIQETMKNVEKLGGHAYLAVSTQNSRSCSPVENGLRV